MKWNERLITQCEQFQTSLSYVIDIPRDFNWTAKSKLVWSRSKSGWGSATAFTYRNSPLQFQDIPETLEWECYFRLRLFWQFNHSCLMSAVGFFRLQIPISLLAHPQGTRMGKSKSSLFWFRSVKCLKGAVTFLITVLSTSLSAYPRHLWSGNPRFKGSFESNWNILHGVSQLYPTCGHHFIHSDRFQVPTCIRSLLFHYPTRS